MASKPQAERTTDDDNEGENNPDNAVNIIPDILYGVNENPPFSVSVLFGLQHYLLALGALLTFPMMVMKIICVDDSPAGGAAMAEILGTFFFVSGAATFVQTTLGLRLPLMQGINVAFFISAAALMNTGEWKCPAKIPAPNSSSIEISDDVYYYMENDGSIVDSTEVWRSRMRVIQGSVAVASIFQVILGATGLMGRLMRFIGPLTVCPVLILVTFSIIDVAVYLAGRQWGIAMFGVVIIVVCSQYLRTIEVPMPGFSIHRRKITWTRRPVFSMFPVLIAIVLSWILCYILTVAGVFPTDRSDPAFQARTDARPDVLANSPWFRFPYPFQWGLPTASLAGAVGMLVAAVVGVLQSIADYYALAKIAREPPPPYHAINRGIMAEGFGVMLAAVLGTGNATTSFSTNIVAVGITRVASRRVLQITGLLFICLGLFTKICGLFVLIPIPVLGAITCALVGMIGSVGMSNLRYVDMSSSRNLFILGISTFMAMSVQTWAIKHAETIDVGVPELNNILSVLLQTGMLIAGAIGCLLDNTVPGSDESRGIKTWIRPASDESSSTCQTYELPFRTDFRFARWIPFCPGFGKKDDVSV